MKDIDKLIASAYFDDNECKAKTQKDKDNEVEAENFYNDLMIYANRIKIEENIDNDLQNKYQELSQDEYNKQKSFELGLIEIADFGKEEVRVFNEKNKKLKDSREINNAEDTKLPINIIKLSNYKDEIVRDVYPATIFDIKACKNSSGLYFLLHMVLEANKFNLEFYYKILSKEYGDLTQFLIEKLGIKFNHKRTEVLSSLKYKKIFVEFEKAENSEYFEIFEFFKDKRNHHEERINQKNIEFAENSSYIFSNDELDLNLKVEGNANYQDVIKGSSLDKKTYEGYISAVKFFSLQKKDNTTYCGIRLICHLLIKNSITEVFKEMPAQLNSTSELSEILVKMGVPLFNIKTAIDIPLHLKDKPILATLTKISKGIWGIDKIFPKVIETKQKGEK